MELNVQRGKQTGLGNIDRKFSKLFFIYMLLGFGEQVQCVVETLNKFQEPMLKRHLRLHSYTRW